VETRGEIDLIPPVETPERNWAPLAIAAGIVIVVAVALVLLLERGHKPVVVTPASAALDPYASSLPISGLVMSESSNLAGGKVTYIDGQIKNTGTQTVSGIAVQILFFDSAKEVTQNETQPLKLIRTRDPYVDLESVSSAPIAPGQQRDFRLIFDAVSRDWDGAYPQIRILHVDSK
jgi:hypothetical protein